MRASLVLAAATAAAAFFAPIAAVRAQVSGPCARLAGESAPGVVEAIGYTVQFEQGRVAAIMLRLPNSRDSTTHFTPVRDEPGRSMRLATFPRNTQPPSFAAVFNQATVGPGGIVTVETWVRFTDRPAQEPPMHNWYRLRCDGTTPGPAASAPPPPQSGGLGGPRK